MYSWRRWRDTGRFERYSHSQSDEGHSSGQKDSQCQCISSKSRELARVSSLESTSRPRAFSSVDRKREIWLSVLGVEEAFALICVYETISTCLRRKVVVVVVVVVVTGAEFRVTLRDSEEHQGKKKTIKVDGTVNMKQSK